MDVITILLSESYFRSRKTLIIELMCYKLLRHIYPKRAECISLGYAQIQAHKWNKPINLKSVLSIQTAYEELDRIWTINKVHQLTVQKKIAFHVGEIRKYYLDIALSSKEYATSLKLNE